VADVLDLVGDRAGIDCRVIRGRRERGEVDHVHEDEPCSVLLSKNGSQRHARFGRGRTVDRDEDRVKEVHRGRARLLSMKLV
jgi:hypothetical protein